MHYYIIWFPRTTSIIYFVRDFVLAISCAKSEISTQARTYCSYLLPSHPLLSCSTREHLATWGGGAMAPPPPSPSMAYTRTSQNSSERSTFMLQAGGYPGDIPSTTVETCHSTNQPLPPPHKSGDDICASISLTGRQAEISSSGKRRGPPGSEECASPFRCAPLGRPVSGAELFVLSRPCRQHLLLLSRRLLQAPLGGEGAAW